jgi:predicted acylesterase/phospholipase RssA
MRPLLVFLCYAAVDEVTGRRLYQRLRADGFAMWFDEEDLLIGQNRSSETASAVRKSDVVLVCLSKASVTGPGQLHRHIKQALDVAEEQPDGTIFAIPVLLDSCDTPDRLAHLQGVELFKEKGYERLKKALRYRESALTDGADSARDDTPDEFMVPQSANGGEPASVEAKEDELIVPALSQTPSAISAATPTISVTSELAQRADPNEAALPSRKTLALIMKGGGIKGLAYAGALREIEKHYEFNWFVGTSAGAITAVLLAAGYSTEELGQILSGTNFKEFLDAPVYKFPTNLYFYGGIYPGRKITRWVNDLLVSKLRRSNPGLEEVALGHVNTVNRVTIYASRRDQDALEFDSADPKWQDMPAAYAVRCSMAIPYVFQPPSHHGSDVFDGGTQNNYPVGIFLRRHPGSEFVGLYLQPEKVRSDKPPSKLSQLISIWTESADKRALQDHNADTVVIDPSPIKTLQFGLSAEEKDFLLKIGRASALEFLHRKQVPGAPGPTVLEAAAQEAAVARAKVISRRRRRSIVRRAGLSVAVVISCLFLCLLWSGRASTLLSQLRVNPTGASTSGENRKQNTAPAANTQVSPVATEPRGTSKYTVKLYDGEPAELPQRVKGDGCVCYAEQHFGWGPNESVPSRSMVITASNATEYTKNWGRWYAREVSREFSIALGGNEGISEDSQVRPALDQRLGRFEVPPLFINNAAAAQIVRTEQGQERLARVLSDSIRHFFPAGGLVCLSNGHPGDPLHPDVGRQGASLKDGGTEVVFSHLVLLKAMAQLQGGDARLSAKTDGAEGDDTSNGTAEIRDRTKRTPTPKPTVHVYNLNELP